MDTLSTDAVSALSADFDRLRAASRREPFPSLESRRDRLKRLLALLAQYATRFEEAIAADFGHRSHHETRMAETIMVEGATKHALRHLKAWMAPRRVKTELPFMPGRNRLLPQPLGVMGVISPWNYPLQLTLAPASASLAAGNLVMIKPSEIVPYFSTLLAEAVTQHFDASEMTVAQGGADVARAFSSLPFDHLVFTGSTQVGRIVAEAAARNLTPVTLELGGKSPAIIDASADVAKAADRIAFGKLLNAGQTCIAPDYVLVDEARIAPFAAAFKVSFQRMYGGNPLNPDYTGIVSDKHFKRLLGLIDDAKAKGAGVEFAVADPAPWLTARKLPPCLITGTTADMGVRKEEIFGPLLPIVSVPDAKAAIAHVNDGDRPLALYWFGTDEAAREKVLRETVAGGVTVNDCLLHMAQENQPFGGVGASGMGSYHGEWGFRAFSKEKPVFYRSEWSGLGLMRPPYGARFEAILAKLRKFA